VALITFAEMDEVVERLRPWVDELIPFPGHPGIPERRPQRREIPRFYAAVRARRFELALQMYGGNPAANEVTDRLGARRTGGFFVPGTGDFNLDSYLPYPYREPEVRRHLLLMRHLGAEAVSERLAFPSRPHERARATFLASEAGLDGPYALVHPGATSPSRRWPAERFAVVGDALAHRGFKVGIIGTSDEQAVARHVVEAMSAAAVDLCGRTDLGMLAAVIAGARLIVGNDSGPAHLAAAVGTPSVAVFLSGDPVRWAHASPEHRIAREQVDCNPCPHLTCPIDHRCASRLHPSSVLAEIDLLLDQDDPRWSSSSEPIALT
jgi:ADP-heptose:LPS heptosyltransferase